MGNKPLRNSREPDRYQIPICYNIEQLSLQEYTLPSANQGRNSIDVLPTPTRTRSLTASVSKGFSVDQPRERRRTGSLSSECLPGNSPHPLSFSYSHVVQYAADHSLSRWTIPSLRISFPTEQALKGRDSMGYFILAVAFLSSL